MAKLKSGITGVEFEGRNFRPVAGLDLGAANPGEEPLTLNVAVYKGNRQIREQ